MKDVMVDLETLGTQASSAVVTIGAVYFDPDSGELGEEFVMRCTDLNEQVRCGRVIDADTLLWWLDQSKLAQEQTFKGGLADTTVRVLSSFAGFLDLHGSRDEVLLWGNGASFDNTILGELYRSMGFKAPWKYSNNRCYRTLKNLGVGPAFTEADRVGTLHNALDDAITQAMHAHRIFGAVRSAGTMRNDVFVKAA